ncbi:MAG: hypothetical protein ACRC33_02865 [Gemmataceae bacterium]
MSLPRGSTIALSPARRAMIDLLHMSRQVPLVAVERRLDLGRLVEARRRAEPRPSWFAIFLRAYGSVSRDMPELRRSYLALPWPRLHQHACTVAALAVARKVGDEDAVLTLQIRHPEAMSLAELDGVIRHARTEPVETVRDFRRLLRLGRLPWPLNRLFWNAGLNLCGDWRARYGGTFGLTGVAALGSASLNLLSPLTTTLTYGVIGDDGSVNVRLFYDHRVLDGVQPAAALERLETVLRGPIVDELGGCLRAA